MSHKFLNPVEVDGQVSAEYLDLSTTTTHSVNAGEIAWNSVDGTFDIGLLNGVTLQAGQEIHFYGKATEAISNGDAVQFAGVQGDHLLIKKAVASEINANPEYFMGVATQDFSNNQFGYVTAFGNVRELDTTSYNLGEVLYFNSESLSVPGLLTSTKPTAPNAKIEVAAVVRVHGTQGILMVRPHVMPKVSDIQDIYINTGTLTQNSGIFWNQLNSRFENKSIVDALEYTPANASGTSSYLSKFTSPTTLGNSQIFDNGTNVLIGTTIDGAYAKLVISGGNVLIDNNTNFVTKRADGLVLSMLKVNTSNQLEFNPLYGQGVTGYIFGINGASKMSMNTSGDVTAISSFRTPTFYDSDNTSYYLNAAGSSNLYDVTANKFVKSGGTSSQFLKADGTVDSNTYATTSSLSSYVPTSRTITINGVTQDLSANRSWTITATETDTLQSVTNRGATTTLRITAANYNFTTASTGAIGLVTSTSSFRTLSGDGTTYGYGISTNTSGGLDIMANQSGQPIRFWAGTTNVSPIQRMIISAGDVTASDSFRAPIFYDSNNTGYYVNPNGISNFSTILGESVQVLSTSPSLTIQDTDSSGAAQVGYISFRNTSGTETAWTGFGSSSSTDFGVINTLGRIYLSGTYTEATGDFRAPIFYDSNNTNFYIDPSSGGTAANLAGTVVIQGGSNTATAAIQVVNTYGSPYIASYYGVMNTSGSFYIGTPSGSGSDLYGNYAYFNTFYDRNNSAYYLDPASTSNLLGLTVGNTITGSITGNSGTVTNITSNTGLLRNGLTAPALIDGLTTTNFRSTLFGSTTNGYQISTARWDSVPAPLSGLNAYSTMIAWAGSDTQGFLAVDYTSPAAIIGGGNGNNINWSRRVLIENVWTNSKYFGSDGAIYGTIFYDSNNTTYFFDGASTGDSIRCAGDIVAYYSDERLKDKKGNIENALEKVLSLNGFYYEPNQKAQELGYKKKLEVGVSAQEVEVVLPEIIKDAPIGQGYKTLDYGKLTPLLIEAIKEQQKQIDELKELVNKLITK